MSAALNTAPEIGLLLPCNVVVEQRDDSIHVSAINPLVMMSVVADDRLKPIALDAHERLQRALASLEHK